MAVEMKLICAGRSPGIPCPHQKNTDASIEEVPGSFPGCFGCQFLIVVDVGKKAPSHSPEWLSQALNEGDGTYIP